MFENLKYCLKTEDCKAKEVKVKNVVFGGKKLVMIAGPCAIESKEQLEKSCMPLKKLDVIRGGAFKPRTSPYTYQGSKEGGIVFARSIADKMDKPIICEFTTVEMLKKHLDDVDIIQVGARAMQNFELLKYVGTTNKPVLIKRGFGNTVEELLSSAEYVLKEGNPNVILCERGIRTFEEATRFTLDLSAVAVIKRYSNLPVVVDPSHAAGDREYIESLTLAAVAAGADGIMIETHYCPELALSDKEQAVTPESYNSIIEKAEKIAQALGREI